ncbi:allergen [Culex quinquefasciatus]|uniref:Allergen n=1 Tax=Culex quinquefasciatus TaxID=7176 RepID=B0WUU0_CULQU|nr:allergen [Culex quinquefasciatus]|eukprot:XP_001859466.1 allergen [Culex quinquefasciatus]
MMVALVLLVGTHCCASTSSPSRPATNSANSASPSHTQVDFYCRKDACPGGVANVGCQCGTGASYGAGCSGKAAQKIALDQRTKDLILREHNLKRNLIACGSIEPFEPAARMAEVEVAGRRVRVFGPLRRGRFRRRRLLLKCACVSVSASSGPLGKSCRCGPRVCGVRESWQIPWHTFPLLSNRFQKGKDHQLCWSGPGFEPRSTAYEAEALPLGYVTWNVLPGNAHDLAGRRSVYLPPPNNETNYVAYVPFGHRTTRGRPEAVQLKPFRPMGDRGHNRSIPIAPDKWTLGRVRD